MANLIEKIRTDAGDLQIDYNALANLPALNNMFSNPNLLINSDFRNPVNQRGKTSYTGTGSTILYTIDRWGVVNGSILTIQDGSLKIQVSSNDTYSGKLKQIFENTLPSDFYTLSVKVKSNSNNVQITNFGRIGAGFTGIYSHTSSIKLSLSEIEFFIAPGASIEIEWIKLEQGSVATPFVLRLKAEELALCQRYYEKRTVIFFPYGGVNPTTYYLAVNGGDHRVTKCQLPKITATALTDHNNNAIGVDFVSATQNKDGIRLMTVSADCDKYLLRSDIEFDAEIY